MNTAEGAPGEAWELPGARQQIVAGPGSSVYAVLHGDMHIRNGHPVYQLMPFPLADRPIPVDRARQQPSRLLAADSGAVIFSGRANELSDLAAWRDDRQPGVSVMLIHAPGGQGKTRLAARFAAESAAAGWTAWAAHHLSDPTAQHVVAPGNPGRTLLLVVDYADRWPLDDLQLMLGNPLLRRPERSRVLLIARPAEIWWPSLRHRLDKAGNAIGPPMALPPLAETVPERREAFATARDAFAAILGAESTVISVPRTLGDDVFRLVLTIHMAALVAVDAHQRGTPAPADPTRLSSYLLDREHDFWHSLHDHQQITTTPRLIARTVYTATLTHSLRRDRAVEVLERVGIASADAAPVVLDDHARCYPLLIPQSDSALEALYPDRLGEDFLALTTPGHARDEYISDPWAHHAATQLLQPGGDAPESAPAYARSALAVLIATAHRWPHIAHSQLYPLLQAYPQLALSAGGAALAALVELPDISMELLEAIGARLPEHRHVDLDPGIAALARRLADHRLTTTDDPAARARIHDDLSVRLHHAGLHEQALAATREALELRRRLARTNPTVHEPDLAASLSNFSLALLELGRSEEALSPSQEAVGILRRFAAANPSAYEADLTLSLRNLGVQLSALGRPEEALAVDRESLEIQRRLARADPADGASALAATLTNLGRQLSDTGRWDEALASSQEAVAVWRRLADANPALHGPDLAASLSNLGNHLAGAGLASEALAASHEAVARYRRLAQANPAAYDSHLASSLTNLGIRLSQAGAREEALAVGQEAVTAYRELAEANPAAYNQHLATSLNNFGRQLSAMGHRQEALAVSQESLEILRQLARANAAAHDPHLAMSLSNLAIDLSRAQRDVEALAAAEEAVAVYGRLAQANPGYAPDFARSLNNLAQLLPDAGRREEALTAAEQAVATYRHLTQANPAAHEPELARSLNSLGGQLSGMGRMHEALAATQESLRIRRQLAQADPARYMPDLAKSLGNYNVRLSRAGQEEEALVVGLEAVSLYRRLAQANPAAYEPDLARSLNNTAIDLSEAGRNEEALSVIKEAAAIYLRLATKDPQAFAGDLVDALDTAAGVLTELGRPEDALGLRNLTEAEALNKAARLH